MVSPMRLLCTTGFTLSVLALSAPSISSAQAIAVKCKDGTMSTIIGRGACTAHGGVDLKATRVQRKVVKSEVKAAKAVVKSTPGTQVTVVCADGSKSTAQGRGSCSGHGGVRAVGATSTATGARVATSDVTENKVAAGAIARCKDGLYSHARNRAGACAGHGGVVRWM